MRRLALALVLLVSLAAATAATAAAPTRTLRVADVKLSFAVPKSWISLNPRDVASAAGKELRRENPQLGAILDQLARPGSPVRLVAFDPATAGGFLTNVNVVVTRIPSSVSFDVYLQATRAELLRVPGLIGTPSAKAVTLPAGRAVRTHLRAGVVVKGRIRRRRLEPVRVPPQRPQHRDHLHDCRRERQEDRAGDRPHVEVDHVRLVPARGGVRSSPRSAHRR